MFKNYLKTAWKIMMKHKMFTFISLFGISITLFFLVVISAFIDGAFGPVEPETRLRRTLSVTMGTLENVDSGTWSGPLFSPYFFNRYVKTLKIPEKISISSFHHPVVVYKGERKLNMGLKFTDSEFWEILDFHFLEGKAYDLKDVEDINPVAVINRRVKEDYFDDEDAVGKMIEVEGTRYKVIGVVENVSILRIMPYSDIWVPMGHSKGDLKKITLTGVFPGWYSMVLARDRKDIPKIKAEFQKNLENIEFPEGRFKKILTNTSSYAEALARQLFRKEDGNLGPFLAIVFVLMVIFLLLPTINLVNINVSRIMDRSGEIGIRKSFGASGPVLIGQFIIENIIVTLMGGILSLILAAVVLSIINNSGIIPHSHLMVNYRVFITSMVIAVFFGLMSGVYPAIKMSRLQPAEALQGGRS